MRRIQPSPTSGLSSSALSFKHDAKYQNSEDVAPRPRTTSPERTDLCSRCCRIDFGHLFSEVEYVPELPAQARLELGKLGVGTEASSCSLCRLFQALKINMDSIGQTNDYAIYSTYHPDAGLEMEGTVLAVGNVSHHKFVRYLGGYRGFIAVSTASETQIHRHSLRARSIDCASIDFKVLRDWLEYCKAEHGERCTEVSTLMPEPKELKLIDCEQRRVVPALSGYEYSALSYVWGSKTSEDSIGSLDSELSERLPQTIEDALTITQELGLRYIWIDRYCINQTNDVEKHNQVRQMDLIYHSAAMVLIAAAGTDPTFGLPGVSTALRNPQPSAQVGDLCLVSTLPDPQLLIRASKWMKRAWTYQESFFSRRRFVFTEQQVYFECRGGIASEAIERFRKPPIPTLFGAPASTQDHPRAILFHLETYSGRELSDEDDAIRAFEGIFQIYGRRKPPVRHYYGIPIISSVVKGQLGVSKSISGDKATAFAIGLCWVNFARGTRRKSLPTWSWAGWTAPINFGVNSTRFSDYSRLENGLGIEIFIESQDTSTIDMNKYDDNTLTQEILDSFGKVIHIEAWTIPIEVQYLHYGAGEWIDESRDLHRDEMNDNVSGYFAVFQEDELRFQIPVYLCAETYEIGSGAQDKPSPRLEGDAMLGIIMDTCENSLFQMSLEGIFVMIVQRKGQCFERIGHMWFNRELIIKSIDSFPWHELSRTETVEEFGVLLQVCLRRKERRRIPLM